MKRMMALSKAVLAALVAAVALVLAACGTATAIPTQTPRPTPTPAAVTVYVGAGDVVYALDGRTGARRWSYDTGHHSTMGGVGNVHIVHGLVYFTYEYGRPLNALDAARGTLRWKLKGVITSGDLATVVSGVAYFVAAFEQAPSATYAIDVSTGKLLWQKPIGGSLAVGEQVLYIAYALHSSDVEPDKDGFVQAFNKANGALLWQTRGHPFRQAILNG